MSTHSSSITLSLSLLLGAVSIMACDQPPDDAPERVAEALRLVEDQRYDEALALVDAPSLSSEGWELASLEALPVSEELPPDFDALASEDDPLELSCFQSYSRCVIDGCWSKSFPTLEQYDECANTCYCIYVFCGGSSCLWEGLEGVN